MYNAVLKMILLGILQESKKLFSVLNFDIDLSVHNKP